MDENTEEYFSERYLQFIPAVTDWKEAIRLAAQPLLEEKTIRKSYVQAMIQNVLNMGDYIILVPNVAMPHARPETGALENGISILKLDEPVYFNQGEAVQLILCLATKDNSHHLQLLQKVSAIIDEEEKVEALVRLKNKKEFIALINTFIQEEEEE